MAGGVVTFANPVDFVKNETRNRRVQNLASPPSNPVEGQEYYDTVSKATRVWDGTAWTNKATDSNTVGGQTPANLRDRATHTGTQTASTISDFTTVRDQQRLDQHAAPTAPVSLNNQKITNLANGTNPADAVNFSQLESARQGVVKKAHVEAASTSNVTIALPGTDVFNGVTVANGERVLLAGQTTDSENGIYIFNGSAAALTRADDADTFTELDGGTEVYAQGGTNKGVWRQTTELTSFAGQTWILANGGSTYIAGNGLTESPSGTFNVGAGNGISVTADAVAVDTAVVVRKFAQTIGDGAATTFTITHNLGTQDITVSVREVGGNKAQIIVDNEAPTTNTATIIFATAPTTNQYRVIIQG